MLRRKLLIRIGLLVACFVAGAAVAIYLLQRTLPEIDRINSDAVVLVDGARQIDDAVARIENRRDGLARPSVSGRPDAEADLASALASVAAHPDIKSGGTPEAAAFQRVREAIAQFQQATGEEEHIRRAELRSRLLELSRAVRTHLAEEQARFGSYLRWLVLGLTLSALVMVNVAVIVLLHTAQVVLRPVAELVQGSRELAAEHFEHRVTVAQQDEFGELARAYNRLAEQLQDNEERKAESLRQLAVTINHDLNNALATIEMQLSLLDRESGRDKRLERYFRDIQTTLSRMSVRVATLKQIRRVVLTEYADGQKMVDLEQSVAPAPPAPVVRSGSSRSEVRGVSGRDGSGT